MDWIAYNTDFPINSNWSKRTVSKCKHAFMP